MKGVRRPIFERHLSERAPKSGSIKSATILSSAMMTPDAVCESPNLSVKIFGISVSYACQNRQIRKKAKPTRTVFL